MSETPARIGRDTVIDETTYIAADALVGNRCKVDAFVYVCTGVTIEDGVMVGANVTFTNDRFPRAATPELDALRRSDSDDETLRTLVREGATIGAGATIGSDLVIGRFAMIGMGSVVTRSVPDFALVAGNPARSLGYVCRCGQPVHRGGRGTALPDSCVCASCGRRYERDSAGGLRESATS
ncbi:MAG TPA: acyltransferase [Acidimicrobiales bacterium]|nr:acyltransferase [Acidimicrobiales bacterium]